MLDSKDEGKRLAAARALFSYGPAPAPAEESAERADQRTIYGNVSIIDVLELAFAYQLVDDDELERIKQRAMQRRERERYRVAASTPRRETGADNELHVHSHSLTRPLRL
jgi:hypothetical protein